MMCNTVTKQSFSSSSALFKTLGDETRFGILCILSKNEMCVGDLANCMSMSKSAVSHQLRELRLADLVKKRRQGKQVFYSIKDQRLIDLLEYSYSYTNICEKA